MKHALEDYLLLYTDKGGEAEKFMRSASTVTVQAWINAHLKPDQLIEVRRVSLGEKVIKDTDQFSEPVDADAFPFEREAARADWTHQMTKELA